jgi:hypothetical protein
VEDLRGYLEKIVEPTVKDFADYPTSVRHAFLACVATYHAVDYMAHPRKARTLRQKWGRQSEAFGRVDEVAHAFKHVNTGVGRRPNLSARAVISRPPAFAGVARCGISIPGDKAGAVTFQEDRTVNLLGTVHEAVAFLRTQIVGAT